jgi:hypothetical protein
VKEVIDSRFIEGEATIDQYDHPDDCPLTFGIDGRELSDWVEHSFRPTHYREDGALNFGFMRVTVERLASLDKGKKHIFGYSLSYAGVFYGGCTVGLITGVLINMFFRLI